MDIRHVITYLYPTLAATSFVVAGLALVFWATRRRTWVVFSQSMCFFAEFATMVVLVLTTGINPIFDIEQFLVWVVHTRILLLAALLFHAWHLWRRIRTNPASAE